MHAFIFQAELSRTRGEQREVEESGKETEGDRQRLAELTTVAEELRHKLESARQQYDDATATIQSIHDQSVFAYKNTPLIFFLYFLCYYCFLANNFAYSELPKLAANKNATAKRWRNCPDKILSCTNNFRRNKAN